MFNVFILIAINIILNSCIYTINMGSMPNNYVK